MDLSTTLSLVQTILTAIQTLGLMQSVCSISYCKFELDDLQNTVQTVRAVLEDADAKQDLLNSQEKNYIIELKDAVYDADDVLDEFLTLAKQNQLRSNKVISFFFRFKLLTRRLSSKVKMVNDKLNKIATKSDQFSFKVDCKPLKFIKEETSSFICDKIIGREDDVEKIIALLLGSNNVDQQNVSLLAIMGMGGLGKTALAQLVFNDPRITEAFPLKRWTCIADQDQQQLDLKGHLAKAVKGLSVSDKMSLEDIHHRVKEQLGGKKYLLVLDDVWTESYDEWQKLEGFLKIGGRGSWIIVTTRSKTTAQMIGGDQMHELRGLSESDSWHLFERMAFQAEERDDELVKLGKEIFKKCTNVPLAIRVVGSLLRGQSKSKWLSFLEKGLDSLAESNDPITRILKLSYNQLNSSLKACFAYCAIFPKDWRISKKMLIQLWMAQEYINSENLGEDYFLILLQRCFFQDMYEDEFRKIVWFKIHDLLHDLAEKVAGGEICRISFDTSSVGKRVRHVSFAHHMNFYTSGVSDSYAQHIFNNTHIRTCLQIKDNFAVGRVGQLLASKSIPKWTCLRSLDLSYSGAKSLPKSIGQLLHLRSLDLSDNTNLEVLPKSITKLVNLQTLDLHSCSSLKQLPDDVSKLVDLSTLDIGGCDALSCMPAGISMLSSLHTLCQFVVGARPSSTSKQCFNGLKDLCHLNKLKGSLSIQIAVLKNAKFVKEEHGGGGYLRCKEHLQNIVINFREGEEYGSKESEQALLEEMEPHRDIKTLELNGYHGETILRWPRRGDNSVSFDFPNLVTLKITDCSELLYLPWQIGKLPHLKRLDISRLPNMEYVADSEILVSNEGSSFFPSLVLLEISELPKLKGWWRRTESGSHVVNPSESYHGETIPRWPRRGDNSALFDFPNLVILKIKDCSELLYLPWQIGKLPYLETLHISGLLNIEYVADSETLVSDEGSSFFPSLYFLEISELPKLKGWWRRTESGSHVVNPSESYHGETIPRWPRRGDNSALFDFPNLVTLKIKNCSELLYLPWQIGKLPHLKTLEISGLPNMEYMADSEKLVSDEGSSFFPSLDNLSFHNLPKLKGCWRRSESGSHVVNPSESVSSREARLEWVSSPCFPQLKNLSIKYCEKMMFVPLCPQLERLVIYDSIRDMRCTPCHQPLSSHPKLKKLEINNLEWLKSMSIEYSQFLVQIYIDKDEGMERLGEVNEFPTCLLSSLRYLSIYDCPQLKSVGGWLEHLSALEYLYINSCPKVELGGMSWHNLAATLHSLHLIGIKEMEELPEGMQYCTSLRDLEIWRCPKLKSMPRWMPKLTSLQKLDIALSSESLFERCQEPNGEDWPLIQHISSFAFS